MELKFDRSSYADSQTAVPPAYTLQPGVDTSNLFVLGLRTERQFRKRQNAFLNGVGQATDSCTNAVIFSLTRGQLFLNGTDQTLQFGTNPGVVYANFTPSENPGSITTTFGVDTQGNLLWENPAFYNFQARFCVTADSDLIAVFGDPALAPTGCMFVVLTLSRLDGCAGAGAGPSGPR